MQQSCLEKIPSFVSAEPFATTWRSIQLTDHLLGVPVLALILMTRPTRSVTSRGSGMATQTAVFPVSEKLVFLEDVLTFS